MNWLERHTSTIRDARPYVLLLADDAYGVPYLLQNLHDADAPLIWLELESADRDNSIRIGNKLSDAVNVAFGARMFGHGMPFGYGLDYLRNAGDELSAFRFAVSGAQHAPAFTTEALCLNESESVASLVIAMEDSDTAQVGALEPAHVLRASDLMLSVEDAQGLLRGRGLEHAVEEFLRFSGGRYESFLCLMRANLGEAPVVRPVPATSWRLAPNGGGNAALSIMNLMATGCWQEAFEVAVDEDPVKAEEIVTEAGDSYFETGQVDRFLELLIQLRKQRSPSDKVMYWYFQANAARGRVEDVRQEVAMYLAQNCAPQLRAAFASITKHGDALREAQGALARERSPESLASVGFLKTFSGDLSQGQEFLKDAFNLYVRYGRTHRAVQIANSIGAAHVRAGEFESGLHWGRWSMGEIARRKVTEEVVHLSTLNLVAFTQLLIGETESGRTLLAEANLSEGRLHVPTLEGILSTVGDYDLAEGNVEAALQHYERLRDSLPRSLIGYGTLHLTRGLRHLGDFRTARNLAGQAVELSMGNSADDATMARLADFSLRCQIGEVHEGDWTNIVQDPMVRNNAPWLAEAVLNRAYQLLHGGHKERASQVINDHSELLGKLGGDVWRLFLGNSPEVETLQGFLDTARAPETALIFMGQRDLVVKGQRLKLSVRFAELLVCLAANDQGLSGEALLLEMYGDEGKLGTLKANLSRLRQTVPIESQPYRLEGPYKADFLEVERLIGEGKVREALELYKGPLLPESEAPGVCRLRERVDEAVRQAVMHAGEPDLLLRLAKKFPDDLELWERTRDVTATSDPAYPLVRARIRRIMGEWDL